MTPDSPEARDQLWAELVQRNPPECDPALVRRRDRDFVGRARSIGKRLLDIADQIPTGPLRDLVLVALVRTEDLRDDLDRRLPLGPLQELLEKAAPATGPFRVGVGGLDNGARNIRPDSMSTAGLTVYEVEAQGHPRGSWGCIHAKTPELARLVAEGLTALPELLAADLENRVALARAIGLEIEERGAPSWAALRDHVGAQARVLRGFGTEVAALRDQTAGLAVRAEAAEAKVRELLELHGGPELDEDDGAEVLDLGLPAGWNANTPNGPRED